MLQRKQLTELFGVNKVNQQTNPKKNQGRQSFHKESDTGQKIGYNKEVKILLSFSIPVNKPEHKVYYP